MKLWALLFVGLMGMAGCQKGKPAIETTAKKTPKPHAEQAPPVIRKSEKAAWAIKVDSIMGAYSDYTDTAILEKRRREVLPILERYAPHAKEEELDLLANYYINLREPQSALEIIKRGADANNANCVYLLAKAYESEQLNSSVPANINQDLRKYYQLLEKAAELNHEDALGDLIILLTYGRDKIVAPDWPCAQQYWQQLARAVPRNKWKETVIPLKEFIDAAAGQNQPPDPEQLFHTYKHETADSLILKGHRYQNTNTHVLLTYSIDNSGERIDNSWRIIIMQNGQRVAAFRCHGWDSFYNQKTSISETPEGFMLYTNWREARDHYLQVNIYFTYSNNQFFATHANVEDIRLISDEDEDREDEYSPSSIRFPKPIPASKVDVEHIFYALDAPLALARWQND